MLLLKNRSAKIACGITIVFLFLSGSVLPGLAADLQIRNDGTVLDSKTGLLWQQTASEKLPWLEAIRYCNELDLAGTGGWRMPFIKEMLTLSGTIGMGADIDNSFFPDQTANIFWTLNRKEYQPDQIWGVSFGDGQAYLFDRQDHMFPVRCLIETAEAVYLPLINKWRAAWSAQDVDTYLACYGELFVPGGDQPRAAWEKQRRIRLQGPKSINVEISNVKVISEEGIKAEIMFQQSYRSDQYQDQVMKVMTLGLEKGELVIIGERTI